MKPWMQMALTIICTLLASSGFWACLSARKREKSAEARMLRGLGHDRIVSLGMYYIERKYITKDEYENLNDYLYTPYTDLGGNGSAKRIMKEVNTLEIRNQ